MIYKGLNGLNMVINSIGQTRCKDSYSRYFSSIDKTVFNNNKWLLGICRIRNNKYKGLKYNKVL